MSSTDQQGATAGLRYGQALAELEELLDELEEADIDVDHLAERVARGVELVRYCRERLAVVTADIDQVVAELLTDTTPDAGSGAGPGAGSNGPDEPATDDPSPGEEST